MKSLFYAFLLMFTANVVAQELPPMPFVQDTTYDVAFTPAGAMLQQLDVNGGILLSSGDDVSDFVSLGFDFTFFGNTYNTAYISSNGFLSFTDPYHGCCGGELLYGSPNTIYAYWTDLFSNNSTYYKTYDLNGQTVFTAGWYNIYELGLPGNLHNFEITLFSGTNDFKITYGNNVAPTYPYSAGIVGPNGEVYAIQPYGYDQSLISNTTYYFSLAAAEPPPEPQPIDCNIAPSDPSCTVNNIINNITTPTEPIIAENNVTPEQSLELFREPTNSTPVQEDAPAAVIEQPIEELFVAAPESVSPVEQATEQQLVVEEASEKAEQTEQLQSETKEEVVASNSEQSSSTLDANLLSLVLGIVESTSVSSVSSGTVASSPTSPSTITQQTIGSSAVVSVANIDNATTSFDLLTQQQEQLFLQPNSESSSVLSSSASNSQTNTKSSVSDNNNEAELIAFSFEASSQISQEINNPVASASSVTSNFASQEAAGLLNFNEEFRVSMSEDSNENFMGEDQSNTIDAIVAGTDFSSYTSVMLFDASAWYKPEDIYKNNKISDNARSLYFMQKGSSDTFNQMIQEQYR